MTTIDAWLDEATPDRREVPVCFDRGLIWRFEEATRRLDHLVASLPKEKMLEQTPEERELRAEVERLTADVREKTRLLIFEGIGWGAWRDLIAEHPPQRDQAKVFKRAVELMFMPHAIVNVGYNAATFVPAAISASCTRDPGISVEQANTMIRKAPIGVIERIWSAVLAVNTAGQDDPFVRPGGGGSDSVPASATR